MFSKKILSIAILFCYVVSQVLSYLGYIQRGSIYASGESKNTYSNLVAVLVDERVYPKIENELKWYTTEYIQKKYDQSKALVLKINTQEYSAPEITKLLENLYFEWEKEKSSQLIGLVMIWEIPFPVVKYSDYVFPSIYPYVDFLDQKYLWNEWEWYFTQAKQNGQAEIWHWVINFKSDADTYKRFFQKLKNYDADPTKFADKKVRYDDFVALQSNFLEENYQLYKNRLAFAEDLMYNRYTNLLFGFFQKNDSQKVKEMVNDLGNALKDLGDSGTISGSFSNGSEAKTPTKMLKKKIDGHLQEYSSSLSVPLQRAIADNIEASNRWTWGADTHQNKIQLKDQLTLWTNEMNGIIRGINDKLENMVDNKILTEKYEMKSVIPFFYQREKDHRKIVKFWGSRSPIRIPYWVPEYNDIFRFYYFWHDAELLSSAQQSSIYRGTFRNLEKVWNYSDIINNSDNPAKSTLDQTNLGSKSFGASYDIFSSQVEANRGYNMMNTKAEYDLYSREKTYANFSESCTRMYFGLPKWTRKFWVPCQRYEWVGEWTCNPGSSNSRDWADCENFQQFWKRLWWGATPLNVDAEKMSQWLYSFAHGYDYRSAWQSIFDIVWSVNLKNKETSGYSFEGFKQYSSPTQISYRSWVYKEPTRHGIHYNDADYFNQGLNDKQFKKEGSDSFSLVKQKRSRSDEKRTYKYRILSSEVKHKATSADQIENIEKLKYDDESREKFYHDQIIEALNLNDFTAPSEVNLAMDKKIDEFSSSLTQLFSWIQIIQSLETEKKQLILERTQKLQERENLLNQARTQLWSASNTLSVSVNLLQERLNALKNINDHIKNQYQLVYKTPLDNFSLAGILYLGKNTLDWLWRQDSGVSISYDQSDIKNKYDAALSQFSSKENQINLEKSKFEQVWNQISWSLASARNSGWPLNNILSKIVNLNFNLSWLENKIIEREVKILSAKDNLWNKLFRTELLKSWSQNSLENLLSGTSATELIGSVLEEKGKLLSGFDFLLNEKTLALSSWWRIELAKSAFLSHFSDRNQALFNRIQLANTLQEQIRNRTTPAAQKNALIEQYNLEMGRIYWDLVLWNNKHYVDEGKDITDTAHNKLKQLWNQVWSGESYSGSIQNLDKKNIYFLTSKELKCLENPFWWVSSYFLPIRQNGAWTGNQRLWIPNSADPSRPLPYRIEDWLAKCYPKQYATFSNMDSQLTHMQWVINSINAGQNPHQITGPYASNSITGNIQTLATMSPLISQKDIAFNQKKEQLEWEKISLLNTLRRDSQHSSNTWALYQKTDYFVLVSELSFLSEELEQLLSKNYLAWVQSALQIVRISELKKDIPLGMYKPWYENIITQISKYEEKLHERIRYSKVILVKLKRLENQIQSYKTTLKNWKDTDNFASSLWEKLWNELLSKIWIMLDKIHTGSPDEEWHTTDVYNILQCLGGIETQEICKQKYNTGAGSTEDLIDRVPRVDDLLEDIRKQKSEFEALFRSQTDNPKIITKGMSDLTPDRPIDSPRYTTFQGIWWNRINLIYPNIFKSEAYNHSGSVLQLKSPAEFKASLEKYLKNKVNEYNTILTEEKNKANANYLSKKGHYDQLRSVDFLATPLLDNNIRRYELFTYDEVLKSIGGEKMLNTLAELLYYQNVAIKSRAISDDITKDISFSDLSFDINNKVGYVVDNYLSQHKDQILSSQWIYPQLALPTYASKGYEVWFINSNDSDTIDYEGSVKKTDEEPILDEIGTASNKLSDVDSQQWDIYNDQKECWFDYNDTLLLYDIKEANSPWLRGFGCWLKEVVKKPAKLSISVSASLSSFSELWSRINPLEEMRNSFDDKNAHLEEKKQAVSVIDNPDKIANTVLEKMEISTTKKSFTLDGWEERLIIQARDPKLLNKNFKVKFLTVGENCLKIENQESCKAPVEKEFKASSSGYNVAISLGEHKAWTFATTIEVCPTDNKEQCWHKTLTFSARAGSIDTFTINIPSKVWAGIYNLVSLKVVDRYKNQISRSLYPYILTAEKWGFLVWSGLVKSIEVSDFANSTIIYRSLPQDTGTETLSLRDSKTNKLVTQQSFQIIPAKLQVYYNDKPLSTPLKYQLTKDSLFIWSGANRKLNKNRVIGLRLGLYWSDNKLIELNTQASLNIEKWGFKAYIMDEKERLKEVKTIIFEKGATNIYLIPTYKAWTETVSFVIPWLQPQSYQIEILPGEITKLKLNVEKKMAVIGEKINGQISLSDAWWNVVTQPTDILLTSSDNQKTVSNTLKVSNWKINISHTFKENETSTLLQARVLWSKKTLQDQVRLSVQKKFLEQAVNSGLNVMYLNLFGTDWGNQRWYLSEKNAYSEKIIKNSDKTLAVTTQLVDLKKVKKASVLLKSNGQLENIDQLAISAQLHGNNLLLSVWWIGQIKIQDQIKNIKILSNGAKISEVINSTKTPSLIVSDIADGYVYTQGILYDSEKRQLWTLNKELSLHFTREKEGNYPIWEMVWNGNSVAKVIIPHLDYAKSTALSNDGKLEDSRWIFSETYQWGSTNRLAKGIFEVGNTLDTNYQGYDSIQNSNDFKKYIGFRADFKNVTLFAGGKSVWESTIPFGSEFLINIWDPLLKRIQKNTNIENTDYNWGIEKAIYSDTTNSIWKVLDIDYNRDGLKDILVIYQDWTIKLQKQYADKQFQDMGILMMTTEQMEDVYVGDIDGNGYEDILIRNSKQQFRAYLNDEGIFDVDGRIACLNTNVKNWEISENPSVLSGVHQVFVRDMDLDKKLDIVTYDRMWDIKVFYGNGGKNNHSYLSINEYSCDDNWRKRQQNSVKTIYNLWIEIATHAVRDESLVRWWGLKIPSNEEVTTQASEQATQNITDQIPGNVQAMLNGQQTVNPDAITNSITKTDMTSAVASTIGTYTKYLQNPVKEQLTLNDGLPAKDQAFFSINTLDSKDKIDVTKEYRDINWGNLLDNDIVEVRVRIKANASISSWAFLDKPYLPAKIKYTGQDSKNLKPESLVFEVNRANIHWPVWEYAYAISDIHLMTGEQLVYRYQFQYDDQTSPYSLKLEDVNIKDYEYNTITKSEPRDGYVKDLYPDIVLWVQNWCIKQKWVLFNQGRWNTRSYVQKSINLQELVAEYEKDIRAKQKQAIDEQMKKLQDQKNITENGLSSAVNDPNQEKGKKSNPLQNFIKAIEIGAGIGQKIADIWEAAWKSNDKIRKEIFKAAFSGDGSWESAGNQLMEAFKEGKFESFWTDNVGWVIDGLVGAALHTDINKLSDNINKSLDMLCQGVSFGAKGKKACKGLPVPFNQAFLAPWNYHVMWCVPIPPLTRTLWRGLPVFHFPGTLRVPSPWGPIPIMFPWGQKGPWDEFLWAWWWAHPSLIRIYAAPTTTAQLGLAICGGPQKAALAMESPYADLGGNCVVTSFDLPCWSDGHNNEDDSGEKYDSWIWEYGNTPSCNDWKSWVSPLRNVGFNGISKNTEVKLPSSAVGSFKVFWSDIESRMASDFDPSNFGNNSVSVGKNSIGIWFTRVDGVKDTKNKILNPNAKWIPAILMWFLENQIEYIRNNLLRWNLTLYLPDVKMLSNQISSVFSAVSSQSENTKRTDSKALDGVAPSMKKRLSRLSQQEDVSLNLMGGDNPFEKMQELFNSSDLVKISTKQISVKIPWIYSEDIESYISYLKTWLSTQNSILKSWRDKVAATILTCPSEIDRLTKRTDKDGAELQQKIEECKLANGANEKLIRIQVQLDQLSSKIFQNIEILEQYKRLPFEIYEWLHVVDKYTMEISSVITNFFGYINHWMEINATRFSQYIDAITTILAVVKTYQVMLDFSANWTAKCWTCTHDAYDQYACKLSFLCWGLKVDPLPIPKMKLPNLIIDLSNINLGMEITLPKFNFVPESIELPRIPNLPTPPSIGLKLDLDFELPDIPLLPEPPNLPELPSLLPQINLELPILPPAPKLPQLPESISKILNLANKIGQIICRVKSKNGLVAESAVKAKIEQMTQRTYEVPFVDKLDFTAKLWQAPLQGLDYQVDALVNLEYSFDGFYSLLKSLTNGINDQTNMITSRANTQTSQADDYLNEQANTLDTAANAWNLNIKADLSPKIWFHSEQETPNEYQSTKTQLKKELQRVIDHLSNEEEKHKIRSLIALTDTDTQVESSKQNFKNIENQVSSVIKEHHTTTNQLANLVRNNYDTFLSKLDQHNESQKIYQLTYTTPLLEKNTRAEAILQNNESIMDTYVATEAKQVDGYLEALQKNSAITLNMSAATHQKAKLYLESIKDQVNQYYAIKTTDYAGKTSLIAKDGQKTEKALYAQVQSSIPEMSTQASADYSSYIKGILVKSKDNKNVVNVVHSKYNAEKYESYYQQDLNNDKVEDLIAWDEHNIYVKYANDAEQKAQSTSSTYYLLSPSLKNSLKKYEKAAGSEFKLYDTVAEVKNFVLKGQSFDEISFSWNNDQFTQNDGYLVRITDRVDSLKEKFGQSQYKYALFLPKGASTTGYKVEIDGKETSIEQLAKVWKLYALDWYNPSNETINFGLGDVPRNWLYLQVSSLKLKDKVYAQQSPWSNQVVGGRQVIWDAEPPVAEIQLVRSKKSEIAWYGNNLEGFVGTYYDLKIDREDATKIEKLQIKEGDKILVSKSLWTTGDSISLENLFFTGLQTKLYTATAVDSQGNEAIENISLEIKTPNITIENVERYSGYREGIKNPVIIHSVLETDIDEWDVGFQRKRNQIQSDISAKLGGNQVKSFPVKTDQTHITGAFYDFGDLIGLYATKGNLFGKVNAQNGEITFEPWYQNKLQLEVVFEKWYPTIKVKENGISIFDILLTAKELKSIQVLRWELLSLKWAQYGKFDGGQVLVINKNPLLYISKDGLVAGNTELHWNYSFDKAKETVIYTIKENRFGSEIAKIEIKTLPL